MSSKLFKRTSLDIMQDNFIYFKLYRLTVYTYIKISYKYTYNNNNKCVKRDYTISSCLDAAGLVVCDCCSVEEPKEDYLSTACKRLPILFIYVNIYIYDAFERRREKKLVVAVVVGFIFYSLLLYLFYI